MPIIHIIPSEFSKELELQLAYSIKAGFPSPAEDYQHETLDFNRDLINNETPMELADVHIENLAFSKGSLDDSEPVIPMAA